MIETVLAFGLMNVIFELVLLSMVPPKQRLRLLGTPQLCAAVHVLMLSFNLIVHWGTVIGTMSSILAFVCSIATIKAAQKLWGSIAERRFYTTGLIRYTAKELT